MYSVAGNEPLCSSSRWCSLHIGIPRRLFESIHVLGADAQAPESVEHVVIPLNKSVTLPDASAICFGRGRAPESAVARALTDRTLYIQAKKIGTTNVSVYDENMRIDQGRGCRDRVGHRKSSVEDSSQHSAAPPFALPMTTVKSY